MIPNQSVIMSLFNEWLDTKNIIYYLLFEFWYYHKIDLWITLQLCHVFFFFSQFWYFITTGSFFSHKCKMQFLKQHGCRWCAGVDVLRIHAVWISSADSCLGLICFWGKIDGVGGVENMQFCFSLSVSNETESKPCVAERKKKRIICKLIFGQKMSFLPITHNRFVVKKCFPWLIWPELYCLWCGYNMRF